MLSESGANSSQRPPKVARRQFNDLVNTELEKVNALTRLKETLIRQNVINEEKISLKKKRIRSKGKRNRGPEREK